MKHMTARQLNHTVTNLDTVLTNRTKQLLVLTTLTFRQNPRETSVKTTHEHRRVKNTHISLRPADHHDMAGNRDIAN